MRRRHVLIAFPVIALMATGLLFARVTLGGTPADDSGPVGDLDRTFLPPEKEAILDMQETERAEALQRPPATSSNPLGVPRPVETLPPITPGIIDKPEPRTSMLFVNRWLGYIGDQAVVVYAGSRRYDHTQGLVYVERLNRDRTPISTNRYETSAKAGPLEVVSVEGARVELLTENGEAYVFDLETNQLIEPTGTPPPATPEPSASSVAVDTAVPVGQ